MPRNQALRRVYVGSIVSISSATTLAFVITPTTQPAESADKMFLDALRGDWTMAGTLGGKSLRRLARRRIPQGRFLKLHMIDVQSPAQCEAELYIAFDARANGLIAHWLDRFGAAGARVVARGERNGQQLVIVFPFSQRLQEHSRRACEGISRALSESP